MRKRALTAILFASLTLSAAFCACGKNEPASPETPAIYSLSLNKKSISLDLYETAYLTATATKNGERDTEAEIVWSSENENVVQAENGKLVPKGTGTTVVSAKYGDREEKCTVTVADSGIVPALITEDTSISLTVGGEGVFAAARVAYKNADTSSAAITYTIPEEMQSVAQVNTEGFVTPVGAGHAELKIAATWNGFGGESMQKNVDVYVTYDVETKISLESDVIYTSALSVDGHEFSNVTQASAKVFVEAAEVAGAKVEWYSSNPAAATVDQNGAVTATGEGETEIYATYNKDGEIYESAKRLLTVAFPIIDKTEEISLDFDLYRAENSVDLKTLFGGAFAGNLSAAYVLKNDGKNTEKTACAVNGNTIDVSGLSVGERTFEIRNDAGYGCRVSAVVATRILKTAADLKLFKNLQSGKNNAESYSYDGYYILGGNIVADEEFMLFDGGQWWDTFSSSGDVQKFYSENYGFTGTFDGRGYTIGGFAFGRGGLFGDLGKNSVVKNLGITNAILNAEGHSGVLCSVAAGATVENCFIEVAANRAKSWAYSALSCFFAGYGTRFENVAIVGESGSEKNAAMLCAWLQGKDKVSLENVLFVAKGTQNIAGNISVNYAAAQTVDASGADFDYGACRVRYTQFNPAALKVGYGMSCESDRLPVWNAAPKYEHGEAQKNYDLIDLSSFDAANFLAASSSGSPFLKSGKASEVAGKTGEYLYFTSASLKDGSFVNYAGAFVTPLLGKGALEECAAAGATQIALRLYVKGETGAQYPLFSRLSALADGEENPNSERIGTLTVNSWHTVYFNLADAIAAYGRLKDYTLFTIGTNGAACTVYLGGMRAAVTGESEFAFTYGGTVTNTNAETEVLQDKGGLPVRLTIHSKGSYTSNIGLQTTVSKAALKGYLDAGKTKLVLSYYAEGEFFGNGGALSAYEYYDGKTMGQTATVVTGKIAEFILDLNKIYTYYDQIFSASSAADRVLMRLYPKTKNDGRYYFHVFGATVR